MQLLQFHSLLVSTVTQKRLNAIQPSVKKHVVHASVIHAHAVKILALAKQRLTLQQLKKQLQNNHNDQIKTKELELRVSTLFLIPSIAMKKKAIIVGASSGIGMEVARLLIADGWTLGVAARREKLLQELKALAPERVEVQTIDVTVPDAGEQLLTLIHKIGGMDLYFHASGIGKQNRTLDADIELQTMHTNAVGFTRMIDAAYRYFAHQGTGHIAAITSIAGTKGLGPAPAYSATKALQATYLQALEQQANQRHLNIHITDIRPGFVNTALLSGDFKYPMLMRPETVARDIVRSIYRKRHVRVIDARYRLMTTLWRFIPNCIWRNFVSL